MERAICLHGHFYQPPRENPWLETVEVEDSAAPFHDWNERITAECYAANAASRILDGSGRIERIVSNYERISFDVGPTLLAWMAERAPDTLAAVVAADAAGRRRFSGHGPAMAQAYNHTILPLCSERDRTTQIRWGLADFRHRFGRRAEGMWLPETAADTATLEALVDEGVAFTVLAPHQAQAWRDGGGERWRPVAEEPLDLGRAYRAALPSGRELALFFYDGAIAREIAFGPLLETGARLTRRLLGRLDGDDGDGPRLVHTAVDGETYGHHKRFGDMALAWALDAIERDERATLTVYGEWLERYPPRHEVRIAEPTSWSCAHGVERWRSDCGCRIDPGRGWHQRWRAPLREALDWLRDRLAELFEAEGSGTFHDPWAARDDYVRVVLDRSPATVDAFLREHLAAGDDDAERRALRLLEMQRHALLMFTSCGWFFDDVGGLEAVQVLRYAARAVQLARGVDGPDLEPELLERLAAAPSNDPDLGDGAEVWRRRVAPAVANLERVTAHWAIARLVTGDGPGAVATPAWTVTPIEQTSERGGRAALSTGSAEVRSELTRERDRLSWAAVHLGDHDVACGVVRGDPAPAEVGTITEAFRRRDMTQTVRRIDRVFGGRSFSLSSLFRDQQRLVLAEVVADAVTDTEAELERLHESRGGLIGFLTAVGAPLPPALQAVTDGAFAAAISRALAAETVEVDEVRRLLRDATGHGARLDHAALAHATVGAAETEAAALDGSADDLSRLERLEALIRLGDELRVRRGDLWRLQNRLWELRRGAWPAMAERAAAGDPIARGWTGRFRRAAEGLGLGID